jgi:hypothetical protein
MKFKPIQQLHREALKLPHEDKQKFCRYEYIKQIYEKYLEYLVEADYKYECIYAEDRRRAYDMLITPPTRKNEYTLMNLCKYVKRIDIESNVSEEMHNDELEYMCSLCATLQDYLKKLKMLMYHPSIYKDEKRLYEMIKQDNQLTKQYYKFTFVNGKLYKVYYELRKINGKIEELYSGVKEASSL